MATISKTVVDSALRDRIFSDLLTNVPESAHEFDYRKVNDRQYGVIMLDANGHERYVRIGAIVAEERQDMTARQLMQQEIDAYNAKQAEKAEKAAKRAAKAEADKAKREAKAKAEAEAQEE